MNIEFQAVAFPILACLCLGTLLLPMKWPTVRLVIGALTVLYALVLLVTSVTASASS